jgi:hypothetical protein
MKKNPCHYVECPKCESNFKVDKDINTVPRHRCWAEEKQKAREALTPKPKQD